ncbi:octanoyl-[acyl-carrier-protein]:protein N-octanoyltransferase LIPT2, mitochondrial [Dermacentor andersoni]|uniref:octanoyl-[acyl-carrier-protein]:protein N-octanoyltransferase LIPT2, mitochondrial n=1 Tax=Dermacentor andersoni TaxID=34620 RepID=UPI0021554BB2|nr:putative lipoyltransferase 2, mitochondrial [Dermacentor andersoni]
MGSLPLVKFKNLGRMAFAQAYQIQSEVARTLLEEVASNRHGTATRNTVLVVEHDPVYTVGIRSKQYSTEVEERLKKLQADFVRTNRGGLVTFHGPGQLVAYPVLYLGSFFNDKSMRSYVHSLERMIINFCARFQLDAKTTENTGVWIGDNKIAAIGVHGSRYITTHGIAINCNTDLSWFDHIVPCGIADKGVTSLSQELGRLVTINEAYPVLVAAFEQQFKCTAIGEING